MDDKAKKSELYLLAEAAGRLRQMEHDSGMVVNALKSPLFNSFATQAEKIAACAVAQFIGGKIREDFDALNKTL